MQNQHSKGIDSLNLRLAAAVSERPGCSLASSLQEAHPSCHSCLNWGDHHRLYLSKKENPSHFAFSSKASAVCDCDRLQWAFALKALSTFAGLALRERPFDSVLSQ